MLQELRIKNFALIDELNLTFSRGFNVLTGETGAGKSIILNAVHLLLGDKATEEMIRGSEEEASVEAFFDFSRNKELRERLEEKGIIPGEGRDEEGLLIRRVISRSGRGRTFINGNLATLGILSEIGEELMSICGQHEHQTLQRVETHVDLLDEFGGLLGLREAFEGQFERFFSLSAEISRLRVEQERRSKERELMAFQSREIEAARLEIGEEESLKEERRILAHAQKLMGFAQRSEEALEGEADSAIGRIESVIHQTREALSIDPSLSEMLKSLESARIQLEEAVLGLRDYARRIEVNPTRLEEIEHRLEVIDRLKRKYGSSVEEILAFKEKVDASLTSYRSLEEELAEKEKERGPLEKEVESLARRLSVERRRVASELKKAIERELASLGMKRTTFEVRMDSVPLTSKGVDRIEFLISPNVGEEVKPLAKIASGGELSRIMLALKRILARVGGRQVLLFDEVDSGIGGAIAEVIGRKLKELSRSHQIVCVTHLPQIACFADTHMSVRKEVKGGRTLTVVERLEKEAVVEEIARMLGGVKVTEKTRSYAREMIENAKKA